MKHNIEAKEKNAPDDFIQEYIDNVLKGNRDFFEENFSDLNISQYQYSPREALDELGLDADLLDQLVEDYVKQIINSKKQFIEYLIDMKNNREFDYTPLRELAHKNLGVARNLRIYDAREILEELMENDDLDYLTLCVLGLEYAAIRLNPICAYETLRLIDIKNSFS